MKPKKSNCLEEIKTRICNLQKANLKLQEQVRQAKNSTQSRFDEDALKIINILDMIDSIKLTSDIEKKSNEQLIIKKIEKRLLDVLKKWQIQEIIINENQLEAGTVRVIDTRAASESILAGTVIEVCRKGYQCNERIIRPADVITAIHISKNRVSPEGGTEH